MFSFLVPSCDYPQLADRGYGAFFNGTYFTVGRPEICVNNSYLPICESVTQEEAIILCSVLEGEFGALPTPVFGSLTDYAMNDEAATVVTDLFCSSEIFYDLNLSRCGKTLVSSNDGCSTYHPQPVLTCYQCKSMSNDYHTENLEGGLS